jgi:threonine/homoserine/homoserine lactone efflux protein
VRTDTLLAFAAAWALLVVLPGPDTALVVARTIARDRRAGLVAAAGSLAALTAHVTFAALGVSAVIASSAEAFTVLKLAGAAYLVVLGLRLVLADPAGGPGDVAPRAEPRGASVATGFRQACLTGLLNPKSALFFLTFLPQFVDRGSAAAPQFAVLGLIVVALAGAWHLTLVALAGRLRGVASRPAVRARFERLTGTVFVVLGTRLAGASR